MKKLSILLAAAAIMSALPSCTKVIGEGPVQTQTYAITDFSGVSGSIGGKINYTIGPVFKVEIRAQRNILDVLEVSKVNGHLLGKGGNGLTFRSREDIVVNISAPAADYLHLSGSGDLEVSGNLVANDLDMGISGSGNITVPAVNITGQVKAVISGSGDISLLSGTAKNEEFRISGSGKLLADAVAAERAVTTISGSGDIQLNLSQSLDATISGSGSVYYRGNPTVAAHISGSGTVRPL